MNHDTTIDAREVEFYTSLAATWWDRDGPFWPLHRLNELRVAYISDALCRHFGLDADADRPLEGLRVVDVGCGGGILSESMARLGAQVTGIDVVEKNIRIASLHAADQDLEIDYRIVTASELVADGNAFDVVLNVQMLHIVEHPVWMLNELERVLAPDGALLVADIRRSWVGGLDKTFRSGLTLREATALMRQSGVRDGAFSSSLLWWRFEA